MSLVEIRHIHEYIGQNVSIGGWIIHHRPTGKLIFFELRDGTGTIQGVIFHKDVTPDVFEKAKSLTIETSCIIEGVIRRDERSKTGYEIGVTGFKVLHQATDEYPISPKEHGVAFLMESRHLWLRSSRQNAILRIRSTVIKTIRDFLDSQGFMLFDAPIFTPSVCEGTTTLFETEYFDDKAYLTQSGQLYAEAGALAFGKVYCFGPTFRAEKSKTRRHLTEFWMVEPEAAFFDLEMDIAVAEAMIYAIVNSVIEKNEQELIILERDTDKLKKVNLPFPKILYDDAIEILKSHDIPFTWGDDFGGDEETIISNEFDKPVFVHRYPAQCKAFYMKNDPERPEVALNCDCLAPEGYGEIVGGGQREDDYETLLTKIRSHGLDEESFKWYLDLRKYGSVPHAGFGLGIERTVAWICGIHHVRETIPFPRLLSRLYP